MKKKIIVIFIIFYFIFINIGSISSVDFDLNNDTYFKNLSNESINANDMCCNGYTLCSIISFLKIGDNNYSLLIDMNGTEVNRWETMPDPAKMLPGGSIISATGEYYKEWDNTNLTQISWDGDVEWDFSGWAMDENGRFMAREHHDFQREGNPVGYYAPGQDFVSFGKTLILAHNTTFDADVSRITIIDDVIYEVFWNGSFTGFEWHASDHIDEMGLDKKSRFGIWLNPGGSGLFLGCIRGDWLHINSVSFLGENRFFDSGDDRFNPDNLIICSRHANFIAIIDRDSGEIVWRVGPDYSKNSDEGAKLGSIIGLHHAHMIPDGLPGAGNILLFDNGGSAGYGFFGFPDKYRFFSRVLEFNPLTFDIVQEFSYTKGFYIFPRKGNLHKFFSPTVSSVQRLPNGNTLVCEGLSGRVFEITSDNEIVWDYVLPKISEVMYRAYRVPPEWVPGNPSGYDFWMNI